MESIDVAGASNRQGCREPWVLPTCFPDLGTEQVHVWRASLAIPDSVLQRFGRVLSPAEQARARRYRFARDRRCFVAGRGILRTILGAYVECSPAELVFEYGPHRVLRRSRRNASIASEAEIMRFVAERGYPVPDVYDLLDDGRAMVMERVDGPMMMDAMMRDPRKFFPSADVLADLHDQLHEIAAPDWLPALEDAGDLPEPEELAADAIAELEGAVEELNAVLALLENPEQMARLRSEPQLIGKAIEEMLRYSSPLQLTTERYATAAVDVGGVTIPRGALVYVVLSAANRDDKTFPAADAFDVSRQPNRHLAFGHGVHYCLGAPLARLEGQIAIRLLLERFGRIELTHRARRPLALRWRRGLVLRGLESLPVDLVR